MPLYIAECYDPATGRAAGTVRLAAADPAEVLARLSRMGIGVSTLVREAEPGDGEPHLVAAPRPEPGAEAARGPSAH